MTSIVREKNNKTNNLEVIYQIRNVNSTKITFYGDDSIEITGTICKYGIYLPKTFSKFVNISLMKNAQAEVNVETELFSVLIIIKEKRANNQLKNYMLREKNIKTILRVENVGKTATINIPLISSYTTKLYKSIKRFVQQGFDYNYLKGIIESNISSQFSMNQLISIIKNYSQILSDSKTPITTISFNDDCLSFYEDNFLAVELVVPENKKQITLPKILSELLLTKKSTQVLIARDFNLQFVTMRKEEYSVVCNSKIKGKFMQIFWFSDLEKPPLYDKLITIMKTDTNLDSRFYYQFINLQNYENFSKLSHKLIALYNQGFILPLIQINAQKSFHKDAVCENHLNSIIKNSSSKDGIIYFREAKLVNKTASSSKIVDWFILFCPNNEIKRITIELRTLENFKYTTRKLQQAITEYSQLRKAIPEIDLSVIIVNWPLTTKWLKYAYNFGVILLDINELFKLTNLADFIAKVETSEKQMQMKFIQKITQQTEAIEFVQKWLTIGQIPYRDISHYASLTGFQIQHIKNLLTYFQVMANVDVNNRYHNHLPVIIDNPTGLLQVHNHLKNKNTAIIIEEELSYCQKRIKKIVDSPQKLNNNSAVTRRRETYDLSLLKALESDLALLLNMHPFWDELQPIGVRLYHGLRDEGTLFLNFLYDYFSGLGLQVVRYVNLLICNRSREIDLLAFVPSKTNNEFAPLLVSATNKSSINSKGLLTHLNCKFLEIADIVHYCGVEGLLAILLKDITEEIITKLTRLVESSNAKISILLIENSIVMKKVMISTTKYKCHREVSFESIYIVEQFFGDFILYSYRKIMLKIIWREKIKK